MTINFTKTLQQIFSTGKTTDQDGRERVVDDRISESEAKILYNTVKAAGGGNSIEVGMAYGVSALVICQAQRDTGSNGVHYAVDPNQFSHYRGAALEALKKEGLDRYVKIQEGPSHMMLPRLIEQNTSARFAFIDGWHTFDYTLIDFFLADKMLEPGGYMAFHDVYGRSKQRVINFILTHRKYSIARNLMKFDREPFFKTLKFFLWRIYKHPGLLFSWYHWKFQSKNSSGLIVLKKEENYEPPFDYYKNF